MSTHLERANFAAIEGLEALANRLHQGEAFPEADFLQVVAGVIRHDMRLSKEQAIRLKGLVDDLTEITVEAVDEPF